MRMSGPSCPEEGSEIRGLILAGAHGAGDGEGSSRRLRLVGAWGLIPRPGCQARSSKALGAVAALGLLAAVASIQLLHRGSGLVRRPFAETPQLLAAKPLVGACPGTISVGGVGPVALTNAKWNSPGVPGGEVKLLDGGVVAPSMWGRTYFAQTCVEGEYSQSRYTVLQLLGKTLQYTVDLSGAGCGCNVAVYLASIASNFQASLCSDYYCDAANICGVRCDEIDIQEANKFAWHSTLHVHDDPGGGGIGYGGALRNNWTVGEYGPGARCIDTLAPFGVAVSFPVGADGDLLALDIALTQARQGAEPCTLVQHVYADHYVYKGRHAGPELSKSLAHGMVPVVSYWSSESLLWLDGRESDGKGGCSRDDPTTCQDTVRLYNFAVTGIQASVPAPAAAAPSSVTPPPATPAPPPAAAPPGTPSTIPPPAPTLAPPPVAPAAAAPTTAAPTTAAVTTPLPAPATTAPAPVPTPAATAAPPPDHAVGGYRKWAADEDAVCNEAMRLGATCGMCGPSWGTVENCSALCDAELACSFFTFFGDGGCRIYKGCSPVWRHAYGVVTSIFERGAPGGAAVVQLPPPVPTPDPPGVPGAPPAAVPAPPSLYEPKPAAADEVCDEAGRLPAPCGDCGPKWGDLAKCRAMCDGADECQFLTYFSDEGCRMYRRCDSTWRQSYGVTSSIYRKGR